MIATNCIFWGNLARSDNSQAAPLSVSRATITYSCIQDADPNDATVFAGAGGVQGGRVTLRNCTVTGNSAALNAGGIGGEATLSHCTISLNASGSSAGGAALGNSTVEYCTFSNNWAQYSGGALTPGMSTFTYCEFVGNVAQNGGAVADDSVAATFLHCTFRNNAASGEGGALYTWEADLILTDCSFLGNSAASGGAIAGGATGEAAQIAGDAPTVNYSCVQGLTGGLGGAGNIGADPRFVDADGPDNVFGTADDNLRLLHDSPCINAGSNAAVPYMLSVDLDGRPRIAGSAVDMGVYELILAGMSRTCQWDGGGWDNNWSTPANWNGDRAPSPGDILVFPDGAARTESVNDYPPGTQFGEIRIAGGTATVTAPIAASTVNVQSGQLAATGIVADTLVIGAGCSVVIAASVRETSDPLLVTPVSQPVTSPTATDAALADPALSEFTAIPAVVPPVNETVPNAAKPATERNVDSSALDRLALLLAMERSATELSNQRHLRALDAAWADGMSFVADTADALVPTKPLRKMMRMRSLDT